MQDYKQALGNAVKRARTNMDMTQIEVADAADIDVRTVLNIENSRGNPKLEVLFPLVRVLNIDSREIFNPELQRESKELYRLRQMIASCTDEEAAVLVGVVESVLTALRGGKGSAIE